ncbi:gibberellin 2-beta-dioxygenase 2-like [Benincasa hispida]|uniref:gibberellin 2-beta-dioxygenase 2-like n=1 Tax=Benincasa hispida TaxID=102211 RepID=UPI0018FF5E2B|nr:gibberellin 2-beta-dioxygenase 2-like [Benincasa hispida]
MVVPPPNSSPTTDSKSSAVAAARIPTIDLSGITSKRQDISKLLVEACENYGFFKLINHGVPQDSITRVEEEAFAFFAMPTAEKLAANPSPPATNTTRFGYGIKNIGCNGDMGELEYLLLSAQPTSVSQFALPLSKNPSNFSCALNGYIQEIKNVACELLDLMAEGLGISDTSIFSRLISDDQSDSLFRINHYRPLPDFINLPPSNKIGFGEHSDPQIFTILRSNDVGGLEISLDDGLWVPVSPDPTAYFIIIGDLFPVLTNGRFMSLTHKAVANGGPKPRMSMAYFASPSLNAWISPLQEMVTSNQPCLYRPFTWGEYKAHIYSIPLTTASSKLDSFKNTPN